MSRPSTEPRSATDRERPERPPRDAELVSRVMRSIRKVDTRPELIVRRIIHALGLRFRLHRKDLPGTPDVVLPRHRTVVLVHGCFWHRHPGCRLARLPRTRPEYWLPKLARNVERDASAETSLTALGWRVLTVWECETRDTAALADRLSADLLGGDQRPQDGPRP